MQETWLNFYGPLLHTEKEKKKDIPNGLPRYSLTKKKNPQKMQNFIVQYSGISHSDYINLIKVKNKITSTNSILQSH